jgi:hypothetical protein
MNFSAERIPKGFIQLVRKIISSEGFELNESKERLIIGEKKKKIVTGISISSGRLTIPRKQKRAITLEVFKYLKYGDKINPESKDFDPLYPERLIGKLQYWKQVESDSPKVEKLLVEVKSKRTF